DWQVLADGRNAEGLALGADLRAVSASFDDPSNSVRLGGHVLLDLRANWAVSPLLELYGRVENAWNERYQTASGYATQGRAAYLGARVRLHP
ncbi:MAG: TonB-dependent receptor, partial [Alteraurantiacibacter sp.]|nr:TonB-dependent receptor [Alteraurantiacibacter sp.]